MVPGPSSGCTEKWQRKEPKWSRALTLGMGDGKLRTNASSLLVTAAGVQLPSSGTAVMNRQRRVRVPGPDCLGQRGSLSEFSRG